MIIPFGPTRLFSANLFKIGAKENTVNSSNATPEKASVGLFGRLKQRLQASGRWVKQELIGSWLGSGQIDADVLDELETRLLMADVGADTTDRILQQLRSQLSRHELKDRQALLRSLHAQMVALLKPVSEPWPGPSHRPCAILVVGVNGSGKTTSIGKIAHRLKQSGHSVLLAAGDTFRAAAVEQLAVWGQRNQVPVIQQSTGADPAAVIFDAYSAAQARAMDVVLADTAGRLQNQSHLMEELKKIRRVLGKHHPSAPEEVWLVLDATIGQNALSQAKLFQEAVGVTGLILTKLDGTAKGGVLFALAHELQLPVRFVGTGEALEDFDVFDPWDFVSTLIGFEPSAQKES
jgi:fused signal recognition particle receptor